jgi:hypothetical protein
MWGLVGCLDTPETSADIFDHQSAAVGLHCCVGLEYFLEY